MNVPGQKLMQWTLSLIAGCAVVLLAACGGSGNSNSGGTGTGTGGTGQGGTPQIPAAQHVVIVVLENTDYSYVVGSSNAPYINSLIPKGGLASNYYANTHPSIGNYFTMTTGQVITNDDTYSATVSVDNVVRQLDAASKSWKVYAENLPSTGYLGGDVPPLYLRRHNPLSFFSDVANSNSDTMKIVDFSQLATDLAGGQLPNYSFIVPNALHSAHSCTDGSMNCPLGGRLQVADTWLSNNLPTILNNSQFQQSGLLVLTFDESTDDNTNGGGKIMTLLLGTNVKAGYTGTVQYDHRSLLDLTMSAAGAKIPNSTSATRMTEFFPQ